MSENTVFLVYGYDTYEYPCNPIKAFASEADARALLKAISDYQETKPVMPSDAHSDDEHDAWWSSLQEWWKAHPAEHAHSHDGFDVMPLPMEGPTHDQA